MRQVSDNFVRFKVFKRIGWMRGRQGNDFHATGQSGFDANRRGTRKCG
jgi:hypothetical protein